MLRPKSAGGNRSFLDDLLGNESDPLESSNNRAATSYSTIVSGQQRQRKSVRFFDDDDNGLSRTRPHSSTLDSLLSLGQTEINSPRPFSIDGSRSLNRSESDWLGLTKDDEDQPSRGADKDTRSSISTEISSNYQQTSNSGPKTSESYDWITAGLKIRQSQLPELDSQVTFLNDVSDKVVNKNLPIGDQKQWQPKIKDKSLQTQPTNVNENQTATPIVVKTNIENESKEQFHANIQITDAVTIKEEEHSKFDESQRLKASLIDQTKSNDPKKLESDSVVYLQTKVSK